MTVITIRDDLPARQISPDLWGVFFEDLNYAADGGLYAELVQNRSFSYSQADHHAWGPLTGWLRTGRVEVHHDNPLGASPAFARLSGDGGLAAITNEGFDGMSVVAGDAYQVSIFARSASAAELVITLETPESEQSVGVMIDASSWTRFGTSFTAASTSSAGKLGVSVSGDHAVDVGFVSLFPANTFRQSDNGMRADLGQAIAELRPKFLRFPGGCIAHGLGLDNLYRWKNTIGPLHDRKQDFNLWGYHQSMGIGYFEYFLFCEQLGAAPLPVLAAGVCCQNLIGGPDAIPLDAMDEYIEDVLDLIEFANGPETTVWGRRRAELGHPESFGLRYLGIGNEDQIDPTFRSRFTLIFDAVKARNPEIEIVGTAGPSPFGTDYENGWEFARELQVPIVDEHMYKAPKWFFENTDRYDTYDRSGPAVYVGEYGTKGNRLINALAEAAFMIGMERNGDVVRFASYAPLLAKKGHTQWVPDLIYFDNDRVMPSLNYYVQQLFSCTSGDQVAAVEVWDAPSFSRPPLAYSGIRLESNGLRMRFEGIELDGIAEASVDLEPGQRTDLGVRTTADSYTIRTKATAISGDGEGSFAIHFGEVGGGDSFEWNFGSWRNHALATFYTADGDRDELLEPHPFSVELGRTYSVEIAVSGRGRQIDFVLDGERVQRHEPVPDRERRFFASAVTDTGSGRRFLRLVNATELEVPVSIASASGAALQIAEATSLFGRWDAGEAFEAAPYRPTVIAAPDADALSLPPYSFTVVELEG